MSVAVTDRSQYRGYRFPPEIIAHAVWLYFRFHLSFRDVQDLLAERGLIVSHETIRQWCTKFGATFATGLRRRRARAGDRRETVASIRRPVSRLGDGHQTRLIAHPAQVD